MAKRKRSMGKRTRGRVAKRSRKSRKSRSASRQIHLFKRGATATTISGNVAFAPYLSVAGVALNLVLNVAEITSLYDQYKINLVVDRYWLRIDPSAQTAAQASFPKLYWCRDLDDITTPSNLNELRERNNCKIRVMNPNKPIVIKYKPNVLNSVYRSGISDAAATPMWNQWIDAGVSDLTHYGYKFGIDDLTNTSYRVDIERVVYFSCRNQR